MLKTFKNLFIESDDKKDEQVSEVSEIVAPKKLSDRKMTGMRSINSGAWNRSIIKPAGIREVQYEGVSKQNTISSGTLEVIENPTKKKNISKSKSKNAIRVAINGFGRIGRAFLKVALAEGDIEIVAVNDLGDIHNMAYLLTYDTVYKKSDFEVTVEDKSETEKYLHIKNGKRNMSVQFISQRDPTLLPWKDLRIDVVVESTGLYTTYDKANVHITSGAKRVVISAPAKKGEDASINGETVLMAINEEKISTCDITSNASCTTNASSPIIAILDEAIGIKKPY